MQMADGDTFGDCCKISLHNRGFLGEAAFRKVYSLGSDARRQPPPQPILDRFLFMRISQMKASVTSSATA